MFFRRLKQLVNPACRRTRRQLSPYLDGELPDADAARLRQHLSVCFDCRQQLENQRFAILLISGLPVSATPAAPPWMPPAKAADPIRPRRKLVYQLAPAAAVLSAVVALGIWYFPTPSGPSWEVESLSGQPAIAGRSIGKTARWRVGERLETDRNSRASIRVARIGQVDVDPNSRLRLLKIGENEYRLALERGRLYASIIAPPRLFQVETPSAVAVDLGCAYTLEVDEAGGTLLRVTSGWVALARNGRESFVPSGAICRAEPDGRLGTPYFEDAPAGLQQALARFDAATDTANSFGVVLAEARARDALTLWQMLARVSDAERERLYDRLLALVPSAGDISKADTLRLEASALAQWKEAAEFAGLGVDPRRIPVAAGILKPVGRMRTLRQSHTATLLPNGRVLLAGGSDGDAYLDSAEVFDPVTGRFSDTGSMTTLRAGHEATLLPNGQVLITGGLSRSRATLASAELYDPATQRFTPAGSMQIARQAHHATLLNNGRVLITGGLSPAWPLQKLAEIYDPATGRFSPAGEMTDSRGDHTATLLPDGRVLIAAGSTGRSINQDVTDTAELFDPVSNQFTATGRLALPRHKHAAVALRDGKVLVIGGADSRLSGFYNSAELYDPATGRFFATGRMSTARYKIREAAAVLADGRVLVAGGGERLEIYDPATGIFSLLPARLTNALHYSTTTLLGDRTALIAGGYGYGGEASAAAWLYLPEGM